MPSRLLWFTWLSLLLVQCGFADSSDWKLRKTVSLSAASVSVAYSPDGKRLALADSDGTVTFLDSKTGSVLHTLPTKLQGIETINILPKSERVVVCGKPQTVKVWSLMDWKLIQEKQGIENCVVSPDEKLLLGGIYDKSTSKSSVLLWDLARLEVVRQISMAAYPRDARFVSGGTFVSTTVARVPQLIDLSNWTSRKIELSGGKKTKLRAEMLQNNQAAFSLGALQDDDAPTHRIIPSSDGSLLALGRGWLGQGKDFVDVWNISTQERVARLKYMDSPDASISYKNQFIAVSDEKTKSIKIFELPDGKERARFKDVNLFAFNPAVLELVIVNGNTLSFYFDHK